MTIQRFWCEEASNIRCVRESDFDAALAREAEQAMTIQELAGANAELIQRCNALDQSEAALREELEASHLREAKLQDMVTTAEQRNATLFDALTEERRIRLLGQEPNIHWESLRDDRRACYAKTDAALKPTESGASE